MTRPRLFSSESVTEGHPDKLADQISDAVLDALIDLDPGSRVACETLVKSDTVVLAGEITTNAKFDHEKVVRQAVKEIGYTAVNFGEPFAISRRSSRPFLSSSATLSICWNGRW